VRRLRGKENLTLGINSKGVEILTNFLQTFNKIITTFLLLKIKLAEEAQGEKGKKFIALCLAICLLAANCSIPLSPLMLKKGRENRKHGAKLIIQKKDGQVIRGELIAVNIQQNFFLLLDSELRDGVIVIIGDVKTIRIVKKSEFWKGAGLGLLIGGAAGAGLVYASGGELAGSEGNAAVAGAILFGVPSALVVGI